MKIDWTSPRKLSWPINAILFNFCKLYPFRDKKLWVFGSREGEHFDDNSKYFFEYIVNRKKGQIRVVWLAATDRLRDEIRSMGYEAYTFYTKEACIVSLQAGVSIYSNGLIDFGVFPLVGGSLVVNLFHGAGIKKIYNDKYSSWKLLIKKNMDKVFSWTYQNLTISTSIFLCEKYRSMFGLSSDANICITGLPRNDIFKNSICKKDILAPINIDTNKRIIMYMPTYRAKDLGPGAMQNIILNLYDSSEIDEALNVSNSLLIVKPHPLTPHISLKQRDNFVIMDYGSVKNNQALLMACDMLITDYSTCCIDYALLNRPITFYMPDHDKFIKYSEPLYDEFFELCKYSNCSTLKELASFIVNPNKDAVKAINDLFEDPSLKNTCYCENVYNAIAKEIGL